MDECYFYPGGEFQPGQKTSAHLTNQRRGKGKVFDKSREIVLVLISSYNNITKNFLPYQRKVYWKIQRQRLFTVNSEKTNILTFLGIMWTDFFFCTPSCCHLLLVFCVLMYNTEKGTQNIRNGPIT